MPQALHGLGGRQHWPVAAMGGRPGCASYASSSPYGLYQQLLSAWVGAAPEQGEEVVRPALERAMKAIFGGQVDHAGFLAHMMGLPPGPEEARLARLSPEGLQRATFASVNAVVARMVDEGPDRARPGGPALGRPDIAPAHRGTGGTSRRWPSAAARHQAARARPGGIRSRELLSRRRLTARCAR